jgi:hypothetical protein
LSLEPACSRQSPCCITGCAIGKRGLLTLQLWRPSDAQPSKWRYLIDFAQNRWGPKPGLFLLACMILTVGAYVIGYSAAQRQRFFWVSEDADPPCVLVRAYSDRVICRLYDRAGSKVLPQYLMLDARKGLPLFRLEEVGPLGAARAQPVVRVRPLVEHAPAPVASNDLGG